MNVIITTIANAEHIWVFSPIGTGLIITYNSKNNTLKWLSEATGIIIKEAEVVPYEDIDDFRWESIAMYEVLINDCITANINYLDNPTIIDTPLGGVAVDLDVLKN